MLSIITNAIITLTLSGTPLRFEVAKTSAQKQLGLMYRTNWNHLAGMVFVQNKPASMSFWMKNTTLKMTLVYLDSDLKILEIYQPRPLSEKIIISKSGSVHYALELNPAYTNLIFGYYSKFQHYLKRKLITSKNKK